MLKDGNWYYAEFERVEAELVACKSASKRKVLDEYLDKLHDDFAEFRECED